MNISIISDTHGQHEKLGILSGDVLIHCGDMFNLFSRDDDEMEKIDEWFGRQNFELILCTGGNHDIGLERRAGSSTRPFRNAVYLQDRAYVHGNVKFYGAPWTPKLAGHAFFKNGPGLREAWSRIQQDTDVLITHTPPANMLDRSSRGLKLGCTFLSEVLPGISPRIHCFGHVHASAGSREIDGTLYVNASSVRGNYELANVPWSIVI